MADGSYKARLPTGLWVHAHLRRLFAEGIPATIAHKGDPTAGTVMLKLNQLERGCRVLTQVRDAVGDLCWMTALGGALVQEVEADAYIARSISHDSDLWVIEVEERNGRHPFEGRVIT